MAKLLAQFVLQEFPDVSAATSLAYISGEERCKRSCHTSDRILSSCSVIILLVNSEENWHQLIFFPRTRTDPILIPWVICKLGGWVASMLLSTVLTFSYPFYLQNLESFPDATFASLLLAAGAGDHV